MAEQETQQIEISEHDILGVRNISTEDFTVSWGKTPFTIKAGKTRAMPRPLANHYAKHLIDYLINKRISKGEKIKTNDNTIRESYGSKIILGVVGEYEIPEEETLEEKVVKINTPEVVQVVDKIAKESEDKFEGLEEDEEVKRLNEMSVFELHSEARKKGLTVDSKIKKMKKVELIEMLKDI